MAVQLKKTYIFIKKHEKKLFLITFFSLILFRIWLATGVPKLYYNGPHDDLFFARAAQSMLKGNWMGEYSQMTLIKAPFYSFFLIISFLSGLPLYLNETLFYIGGCIILYFALKPLIENSWWRLLIFLFVMFTPNSLPNLMLLRVHREFVYYSLTLYITAFAIGLMLRICKKPKKILIWSVGLGLSMGAFLLTREEGVWIYPILGIFFILSVIKIWRGKLKKPIAKSLLVLLPIPIWFLPILLISFLNYSHYGFWGVSEQLEPKFNHVFDLLAQIETEDAWHPAIQITESARMAAYEASPTLRKFQPLIEQNVKYWDETDQLIMSAKPDWYLSKYGDGGSEIGNGLFLWLFRDAVYQKGYYRETYPKDLYIQIGNELEQACNSGALDCRGNSVLPAMAGTIDKRHLPIIMKMFLENINRVVKLELTSIYPLDINNYWPDWPVDNQDYAIFDQFSYNPVDAIETVEREDLPRIIDGVTDLRFRALIKKEKFMVEIKNIYQLSMLPLSIIAAVNWFVLMFITIFRKGNSNQNAFAIISSFILLIFLGRLGTLTIVDATTSIPGIYYSYSTQILLAAFSIMMFIWGINFLCEKKTKRINKITQNGGQQ